MKTIKTLVIINGVTGAIGTACFARFCHEPETTVIGLSRQAPRFSDFTKEGLLSNKTIICSIGDISDNENCRTFVQAINLSQYDQLFYIHAVGIYPFELGKDGSIVVSNDNDGDGIDDRVTKLTHDAFFAMNDALIATNLPVHSLIFGGIADVHHLSVHQSWWRVIEKVKNGMRKRVHSHKNINHIILNISSVICPHEVITRPFVFQSTDADPRFWLMPHEVANKVVSLCKQYNDSDIEENLFHPADYYHPDHYTESVFTKRKMDELGMR